MLRQTGDTTIEGCLSVGAALLDGLDEMRVMASQPSRDKQLSQKENYCDFCPCSQAVVPRVIAEDVISLLMSLGFAQSGHSD